MWIIIRQMVDKASQAVDNPADELPLPRGLGPRIRYVRDELRDLTQGELADAVTALGVPLSRFLINRIEAEVRRPEFMELWAIAAVLEVTFAQLGVKAADYPEILLVKDERARQVLNTRVFLPGKPSSSAVGLKAVPGRGTPTQPIQPPLMVSH